MSTRKLNRDDLHEVWAADSAVWRAWLLEHHETEDGVWLHIHKKASGKQSIAWSQAVDEALCFGWIDSQSKSIDDFTYKQYFAPRKPNGNWSKINKAKIEQLIAAGKMMPAGLTAIERAKANGSWENLDEVEAMTIPTDLIEALAARSGAQAFFDSLSKTNQWYMLYWINAAKRPSTRSARITEIANSAAEGKMPARYRQ